MSDDEKEIFSFSTIENFDDHIDMSIPNYSSMNNIIIEMSRYFVEDNTKIIDIGCSTGKLLNRIKTKNATKNVSYYGLEIEENFTKDFKQEKDFSLMNIDILEFDSFNNSSFITSIFTLQFIPIKDRLTILKKIYDGLNKGGAFVFSEKILSSNSKIQDMLSFMYYDFKKQNFSNDEILNKEYDLRGIMKSITLEENYELLRLAGFSKFEVFWRNYNFLSIIAIK